MCLLKVFLEAESDRKLIASDVALIYKEGTSITLKSIELKSIATLEQVDITSIDTLNSILILKSVK